METMNSSKNDPFATCVKAPVKKLTWCGDGFIYEQMYFESVDHALRMLMAKTGMVLCVQCKRTIAGALGCRV